MADYNLGCTLKIACSLLYKYVIKELINMLHKLYFYNQLGTDALDGYMNLEKII